MQSIWYKDDRGVFHRLNPSDICSIEYRVGWFYIKTATGPTREAFVSPDSSLSKAVDYLNDVGGCFVLIDRSTAINLDKVMMVEDSTIVLSTYEGVLKYTASRRATVSITKDIKSHSIN